MTSKTHNYVGAVYDYDTDRVLVWERTEEGRVLKRYKAPHYFYVPDDSGEFTSIYGDRLKLLEFETQDALNQVARQYRARDRFESDIPPLFKVLMNEYYDVPVPVVNFAFLDIEVDYKSSIGFAGPSNPYAPINAVTIYQSWTGKFLTYVVPPLVDGVKWTENHTVDEIYELFDELVKDGSVRAAFRPEIVIVDHEIDLLTRMVADIQDADIISGWNSEFFDLPYIIKRLQLVAPKLVDRLCFPGCRKPRERQVEKFGSPETVYSLHGRTHLDYKDLYDKFTFEGRESLALGYILQEEVGVGKLHYDGTLEQLYNRDFARFTIYNFRDVDGLVQLDQKFKFIQLVNQMAHENTCLFENVLGTVRYVETGIANRAHNVHNRIVPDKEMNHDGEKVEGALVLNPKIGLHKLLGSVDINSLYPNVMRSLNISPEKFIGQFSNGEEDWKGIMARDASEHLLVDRDGESAIFTGAEWHAILQQNSWALSAYGTVFDQSTGEGLVPDTIGFWFSERKRLQAEKKRWAKIAKEETDPVKKEEAEKQVEHYDLLQLTKKIQLNSTYGALLNVAFRFGRKEMGASVTACGRYITTHMMETIHSLLEDEPAKIVKTTEIDKDGKLQHIYDIPSSTVIYGDTDSCYFKTHAENKADAVTVADEVARLVNDSFPAFMRGSFNCQPGFDTLIKAGREVVALRGLFQAKKKYILNVIDLEGTPVGLSLQVDADQVLLPEGVYSFTGNQKQVKLKSQGSEIKKSDTPKVVQNFLKVMMSKILSGAEYPEIEAYVNDQRKLITGSKADIFDTGVAKQANNLDALYAEWQRTEKPGRGKVTLPGHIRAAVNYNEIVQRHEQGAKLLKAGDKVKIFYLKNNVDGLKSIAFPSDANGFPQWFGEHYAVDRKLTEQKMIDNKLKGIFDALNWDVPTPQNTLVNKILKF